MDLLLFLLSSIAITMYLAVQTRMDIATKTVYKNLNNFMIVFMGLNYVSKCVMLGLEIQFQAFVGICVFFMLHALFLKRMMGIGDAKALVVMFLQSGLIYKGSSQFDLFYPVFVYFLASLFFTIVVVAGGIKEKKKMRDILFGKDRRAFFPFLFPAYAITVVCWMLGFSST